MEIINDLTKASLKKIVASKGSEEGFFYYAGNSTITTAALRITMKKKDKSGQVVMNQGKAVRKEIKGSKFGRGEVTAADRKVRFILQGGTASRDLIQKSLTRIFSQEPGLAYLRKAKVVLPDQQEIHDENEIVSEAEMREVEMGLDSPEMTSLLNDQANISEANQNLVEAFLSVEGAVADFAEQFTSEIHEIDLLLEAVPMDGEAIQQKRRDIASLIEFGEEMDNGYGVPLELVPVVNAAFGDIGLVLYGRLEESKRWLRATDEALAGGGVIENVKELLRLHVGIVENSFNQLKEYTSTQMGI